MKKLMHAAFGAALALALAGCMEDQISAAGSEADDPAYSLSVLDEAAGSPGPGAICMGGGMHGQAGFVMDVLRLTDEQKLQVKTALEELRVKDGPRGPNADLSSEDRKAVRQSHLQSVIDAVTPFLTEEQLALAASIKAQLDLGQVPKELVAARADRLSQHLGLDDARKAQISEILSESMETGYDLHESGTQGKGSRDQMKALMDQTYEKIAALLTPEQLEIFNKMHADRQKDCPRNGKGKKGGMHGKGGMQRGMHGKGGMEGGMGSVRGGSR